MEKQKLLKFKTQPPRLICCADVSIASLQRKPHSVLFNQTKQYTQLDY